MNEQISERFDQLLTQGQQIISTLPRDQTGFAFWVATERLSSTQAWISSISNLLKTISEASSYFVQEADRLLTSDYMKSGIPVSGVQKFMGLLQSAHAEWKAGLLRRIEYMVAAQTFDDFLDNAAEYHRSNKKIEAAVLASAVLEDTIKKIASKAKVTGTGKALETLIDDLVRAGIVTPVKAKRIKGYAGLRNNALHAEWDAFDIRDVGELISGIRSLIDEFL